MAGRYIAQLAAGTQHVAPPAFANKRVDAGAGQYRLEGKDAIIGRTAERVSGKFVERNQVHFAPDAGEQLHETPGVVIAVVDAGEHERIRAGSTGENVDFVRIGADLSFEVVDREKAMVRLGTGSLEGGVLTASSMASALDTLARFKRIADSRGVEEIIATATSSMNCECSGRVMNGLMIPAWRT